MNARTLGWLALALLLGCVPSPRRPQTATGPYTSNGVTPTTGGQTGQATDNTPLGTLNRLNAYLQSQGFTQVGPAMHGTGMMAGSVMAYPVQAQAGACYIAVGIAQAPADLDLVVLANNQEIGRNMETDPHPWVLFCPAAGGNTLARVQMATGSGDYYYALFQGSTQARPDLASFFGAAQQQSGVAATIDPGTMQRVSALDQRLTGYRRLADPIGTTYGFRDVRSYTVNLQQGACYSFAAFGGQGATNADIFLTNGTEYLVADNSAGQDAVIEYCAPTTGPYTLQAQLFDGAGPIFVAAYERGAQPSSGGDQVIASTAREAPGLEENFRLLDGDMISRGYERYGQSARGELAAGATRDFPISLEGGKCYAILAVGDNGVRDLDIALVRGSQALDRDVDSNPRPIVRVCPRDSGEFTMRVTMADGAGNFVYGPYRWPQGTSGAYGLSGLIYVRLQEIASLLAQQNYQADIDVDTGEGSLAREGTRRSHNLRLSRGACYSIVVVGGDGVNDLDVTLSAGSANATDGTRNAFPTVQHCVTEGNGRYSLAIEAKSGSGRYFYQVFRQGS